MLGPLLARRGYAKVSLPGGCAFGDRPVDLHLKGMRALGAEIEIEHGYVIARAKKLRGANIYLGGPAGSSVLGTGNVMMAACLAEGQTVIEHAACEPEVVDLANFLNAMGASIEGAGSHRIRIKGVRTLEGCAHDVIPDRIEAATLLMAGSITGGEVTVTNIDPKHLEVVFDKFREAGIGHTRNCKVASVSPNGSRPKEVEIATLPYPGFPTDLQAQMMALMSLGNGASVFTDGIYPDRLNHVAELNAWARGFAREHDLRGDRRGEIAGRAGDGQRSSRRRGAGDGGARRRGRNRSSPHLPHRSRLRKS